jgi:hypothetical protein
MFKTPHVKLRLDLKASFFVLRVFDTSPMRRERKDGTSASGW